MSRKGLNRALNKWVEQLVELEERGVTDRATQADELGLTLATHIRRLTKAGFIEPEEGKRLKPPRPPKPPEPPTPPVEKWIHWTVQKEHQKDVTARKLSILREVAKGRDVEDEQRLGQAIRWAQDLVDRDLDIDYSYVEGFQRVGALWDDWHLKRLLDAAKRAPGP
ncbi:hypothetical protein [Streptosporangium subroseum]|uniref:hypothetical protein n=1 Tax=Streptosporangium subroseum TaxID=106412 RepID=UPI00308D6A92|nr:hypothetical protein OHB15_14185 [Streptosporangium subroseum]